MAMVSLFTSMFTKKLLKLQKNCYVAIASTKYFILHIIICVEGEIKMIWEQHGR